MTDGDGSVPAAARFLSFFAPGTGDALAPSCSWRPSIICHLPEVEAAVPLSCLSEHTRSADTQPAAAETRLCSSAMVSGPSALPSSSFSVACLQLSSVVSKSSHAMVLRQWGAPPNHEPTYQSTTESSSSQQWTDRSVRLRLLVIGARARRGSS
eukprot:COSAG01_NODE_247_length_20443_cov_52.339543_10_plen_154_part_00